MKDVEERSSDMLVRVRDFGANRATDFPVISLGGQLFAEIAAVIEEVAHHAVLQTTNAAPRSTVSKAAARAALREDLQKINRTASAIAVVNSAVKKKFRLPRFADQALLNGARAFAEEVEPFVAEFTKHELPADFLVTLKKDIDAFQAAVTEQNHSKEARVEATASLNAAITQGLKAVQRLDAIVKNKYQKNSSLLAAWASARHLERNNGKSKDQATPDQTAAAPAVLKASAGSAAS